MYKVLFSCLILIITFQPQHIFADGHGDLISGVINAISVDENNHLNGILLMTSDGQF